LEAGIDAAKMDAHTKVTRSHIRRGSMGGASVLGKKLRRSGSVGFVPTRKTNPFSVG